MRAERVRDWAGEGCGFASRDQARLGVQRLQHLGFDAKTSLLSLSLSLRLATMPEIMGATNKLGIAAANVRVLPVTKALLNEATQ